MCGDARTVAASFAATSVVVVASLVGNVVIIVGDVVAWMAPCRCLLASPTRLDCLGHALAVGAGILLAGLVVATALAWTTAAAFVEDGGVACATQARGLCPSGGRWDTSTVTAAQLVLLCGLGFQCFAFALLTTAVPVRRKQRGMLVVPAAGGRRHVAPSAG